MTLLAYSVGGAEEKPGQATLKVGENLTYVRGTARAKEEILEFPYQHRNTGNRTYWASVVHDGKSSRLICKESEAQGKKDKTGRISNQKFDLDHPFQKVLDQIKSDAFFNVLKELRKQKPTDKTGWKILGGGSAVHSMFYRDSKGRIYCFLGVQEKGLKTIQGPVVASFQRTRQGPMMSMLQQDGKTWSPFQQVDPNTNSPSHRVLLFLEKRNGF